MRKLWILCSLLLSIPAMGQTTVVTALVTDGTGQTWNNGTFTVNFWPVPGLPNNYQWQGAKFVPQQYLGTMDGSGSFSVTLPDNNTITPSGTQWQFVLCPNATAACTTIVTPVTGASENLSSLFSSRVVAPVIFSAPMPRAYSTSEVAVPPPLQGGQFYRVTDNVPLFWTGTMWKALGGTVQSVGLTMPSIFTVTGSPVTDTGTFGVTLNMEPALTVFGNNTTGSAVPAFNTLTAAQVAQAGTLSNNTTGNANTATTATNVSGGFVSQVSPGTGISVSPSGGQGHVTVTNAGVTSIVAGTHVTISPSGGTGAVTVNAVIPVIRTATLTPGCTTPAGPTGTGCTDTLTWSGGGFVDTNYQVSCSGGSPVTSGSSSEPNALDLTFWGTKTTTTINTETVAKGSDGGASFGTIDCIGVHN